jgi:hypothetical protein
VLVVAGVVHGRPKEQLAQLIKLRDSLLFEQLFFAALSLSTAVDAVTLSIAPIERSDTTGRDALAAVDADHPAISPVGLRVVRSVLAAEFPGHRPPPEAGDFAKRYTKRVSSPSTRRNNYTI